MYCRRVFLLALIAIEFGCQKKAAGPAPRYAVLRFENLSGDPSLDWIGRAASEHLSVSLSGALAGPMLKPSSMGRLAPSLGSRPATVPGISSERAAARLAGATRLIEGYIQREGTGVRITASEEDLATGKTLRTVQAVGPPGKSFPLPLLNQIAHEISPTARPFLTSSAEALHEYLEGEESSVESSQSDMEEAATLDPNFGPAWIGRIRLARLRGDQSGAERLIAEAKTHKLDPQTIAELDSEKAAIGNDPQARIEATRKLSALNPGDVVLLRSLAESEAAAGNFTAAASDWRKLAAQLTGDPLLLNSLGYARAWAGDYAGAMAAMAEYQRMRPAEANPFDSTGDIQYMEGKFGEAAASYLQAHAKDANFQRGGESYKAAWAKFKAGDKKSADSLFEQFRAIRQKASDPLLPLLNADWLYRTGREADGVAYLRNATEETQSAPLRAEAYAQLAIWDLLANDRAAAASDAAAAGPPKNAPMLIIRFATGSLASVEEWQARADRLAPGAAAAPFRRLALGFALLLDGKKDAAIPVWAEIAKETPATDFFNRAIYARLLKQPGQRPLLPDPNNVNQMAGILDKI